MSDGTKMTTPLEKNLLQDIRVASEDPCSSFITDQDLAELEAWAVGVLPEGCGVAAARIGHAPRAFDVEEKLVGRAVESRRQAFRAGRFCARTALARIGRKPAPILRGAAGEPFWPHGVCGAISHARDVAIAIVAPRAWMAALGVDIESSAPLDEPLLELVCDRDEGLPAPALAALGVDAGKLVFVAKETAYKALYPQDGRLRGFHDGKIVVDAASASFHVRLREGDESGLRAARLKGRFHIGAGMVAALVYAGCDI